MGTFISASSCRTCSASPNFPSCDSCSSTRLAWWRWFVLRGDATLLIDFWESAALGIRTLSYSFDHDSKREGSGEADGYGMPLRAFIEGVSSESRARDELKDLIV